MPTLTVLGSGTCVPRARRGPAGYAIEAGDSLILLDSGSGTLSRLHQVGLDFRALTHAIYTHTHIDHTADLPTLLFATNYTPDFQRFPTLHLMGPPGFADFVDKLAVPWPWTRPRGTWLEIGEIDDATIDMGSFTVRGVPVDHGGIPANAYRIEAGGKKIVFSGDTGMCDNIVDIARDADVLIIEASFPVNEDPGWHLTAAEAGRVATQAGARLVILTHLYPACDKADMVALCQSEYDGPVRLAEDLMRVEL
jgi:ribonuclease BN (tRNA processing enzyme)